MDQTIESIYERLEQAQKETRVVLTVKERPQHRGDGRDLSSGELLVRSARRGWLFGQRSLTTKGGAVCRTPLHVCEVTIENNYQYTRAGQRWTTAVSLFIINVTVNCSA